MNALPYPTAIGHVLKKDIHVELLVYVKNLAKNQNQLNHGNRKNSSSENDDDEDNFSYPDASSSTVFEEAPTPVIPPPLPDKKSRSGAGMCLPPHWRQQQHMSPPQPQDNGTEMPPSTNKSQFGHGRFQTREEKAPSK